MGNIRAGQGAGDHILLDPVNIPYMIFDAGECQGGDADPAVLASRALECHPRMLLEQVTRHEGGGDQAGLRAQTTRGHGHRGIRTGV